MLKNIFILEIYFNYDSVAKIIHKITNLNTIIFNYINSVTSEAYKVHNRGLIRELWYNKCNSIYIPNKFENLKLLGLDNVKTIILRNEIDAKKIEFYGEIIPDINLDMFSRTKSLTTNNLNFDFKAMPKLKHLKIHNTFDDCAIIPSHLSTLYFHFRNKTTNMKLLANLLCLSLDLQMENNIPNLTFINQLRFIESLSSDGK